MNKNLIIGIIVVLVVAGGGFFIFKDKLMTTRPAVETSNITTPVTDGPNIEVPAPVNLTDSTDSSMTENVKEFTVTASNFKFDNPEIKVKKGDTVKITFKNAGGFHDFVIDEFKVAAKQSNGPSQEILTFIADRAGDYEFYCSVGQHRANGMEGKFIVE